MIMDSARPNLTVCSPSPRWHLLLADVRCRHPGRLGGGLDRRSITPRQAVDVGWSPTARILLKMLPSIPTRHVPFSGGWVGDEFAANSETWNVWSRTCPENRET